jgi:hypothetical protein
MITMLLDDNKMSIQPEKSTWMMASLGIQKEQLEIKYAGEKIAQEKQVIGLGVALDNRMTMNAHLEHLRLKALKGVGILKYVAAQNITHASL